jgi:CrcB protein
LIVGIGGFVGAVARYVIGTWLTEHFGTAFPWGTLLINISGSLALALFIGWFARQIDAPAQLRLLFAIGFCGAYTTFSTFAVDTVTLAEGGKWLASIGNLLLTNVLCLLAAVMGLIIGGRV